MNESYLIDCWHAGLLWRHNSKLHTTLLDPSIQKGSGWEGSAILLFLIFGRRLWRPFGSFYWIQLSDDIWLFCWNLSKNEIKSKMFHTLPECSRMYQNVPRCPNFLNWGHVTTQSEDQLFLNVEAFCVKNLLELKISVEGNCISIAFLDYWPLFTKETFP